MMNCSFCNRIMHLIKKRVEESLGSQHAYLSRSEVERLIDFRVEELAEKLIELIEGKKVE